jgi:hypothetical protein
VLQRLGIDVEQRQESRLVSLEDKIERDAVGLT